MMKHKYLKDEIFNLRLGAAWRFQSIEARIVTAGNARHCPYRCGFQRYEARRQLEYLAKDTAEDGS
jgi:hypothetical protein